MQQVYKYKLEKSKNTQTEDRTINQYINRLQC